MSYDIQKLSKSTLLLKNSIINLTGQIIPIIVALMSIPFIIKGLGVKKFGILSLCWAIISSINILDISLNKATNKFLSEELCQNNLEKVNNIIWSAIVLYTIFSISIIILITPVIYKYIDIFLKIPASLSNSAKYIFTIILWALPIILCSGVFRSILECYQRFDLINIIRVISNLSIFIIPIIGIFLKIKLKFIILDIIVFKLIVLLLYVVSSLLIYTQLRYISISFTLIKKLISYNIWLSITSLTGPIINYIDRFFIGSILSITDVTYYSAPYDGISRLGIISTSFSSTLFPIISAFNSQNQLDKILIFIFRILKYIVIIEIPIILIVIIKANVILQIWLNHKFVIYSKTTLQILSIGIFINSLAIIPFIFFQGSGRPDIPAKFHIIELPCYIVTVYILVKYFGITGAAISFLIRIIIDTIFLFISLFNLYDIDIYLLYTTGIYNLLLFIILFLLLSLIILKINSNFFYLFILLSFYYLIIWKFILDHEDKKILFNLFNFIKKQHN